MGSHDKITAVLILDIIGKPPKHLIENLERFASEMSKEEGVLVKDKHIHEPVPMKENKEFFTTFAEIEVETEDMMHLALLMFKYMPAHIEVISPEGIELSNAEWSEILSELIRRLHSYDEVTRIMQAEKNMLIDKIRELQGIKVSYVNPEEEKEKNKKGKKAKARKK